MAATVSWPSSPQILPCGQRGSFDQINRSSSSNVTPSRREASGGFAAHADQDQERTPTRRSSEPHDVLLGHLRQQGGDIRDDGVSIGLVVGRQPVDEGGKRARLLDPLPDVAADIIKPEIAALFDAHHDDLAIHFGRHDRRAARDRRRLGNASCFSRISCFFHGVAVPCLHVMTISFPARGVERQARCPAPNREDDYVGSGAGTTSKATEIRDSAVLVGRVQWAKYDGKRSSRPGRGMTRHRATPEVPALSTSGNKPNSMPPAYASLPGLMVGTVT